MVLILFFGWWFLPKKSKIPTKGLCSQNGYLVGKMLTKFEKDRSKCNRSGGMQA